MVHVSGMTHWFTRLSVLINILARFYPEAFFKAVESITHNLSTAIDC